MKVDIFFAKVISLLMGVKNQIRLYLRDKPLPPPTSIESQIAEEIKNRYFVISNLKTSANSGWEVFLGPLLKSVETDDIRSFLRWDSIIKTMFTLNQPYIKHELQYLKTLESWKDRWSKAIVESRVGNPIPSNYHSNSSDNLIHHAYHLAKFEEYSGNSVDQMKFVFEFGGGYGSMCRLFYNLGFRGSYIIFDLPHFSILQEYFLKAQQITTVSDVEEIDEKIGVSCISKMEDLETFFRTTKINLNSNSLFLATWSLSESSMEVRNKFFPLINAFSDYLVAYHEEFCDVDNVKYFKDFKDRLSGISWKNSSIDHLPGNHYYLMGNKRLKN
jgi:hypothetical protein